MCPPTHPNSRIPRCGPPPFRVSVCGIIQQCLPLPQVIIGLTLLAYRHEGLRVSDVVKVMRHCKESLLRELGPTAHRPSHLLYTSWLKNADLLRRFGSGDREGTDAPLCLPLQFLRVDDGQEIMRVYDALARYPPCAMFLLQRLVFPALMKHQAAKITASGADLGSSILFDVRLGFSGTPSDLLPKELGACNYEPGSQAKIRTWLGGGMPWFALVCVEGV